MLKHASEVWPIGPCLGFETGGALRAWIGRRAGVQAWGPTALRRGCRVEAFAITLTPDVCVDGRAQRAGKTC